jgi:HEPN domain-containing protein
MKGDPNNPADWLKLAMLDLHDARDTAARSSLRLCVYCLQQAAEKALKGWLIGQGWSLIKTHDLPRLLHEATQYGLPTTAWHRTAQRLTQLYFTDRYIDTSPDADPDDAECQRLLAEVEQIIIILFPPAP